MNLQEKLCEVGGLIYHIPDSKLIAVKNSVEFPSKVMKVIDLLKFPDGKHIIENKVIIFGTYNLKLQPFYGDIDMRCKIIIDLPEIEALQLAKEGFQHIVKRIEKTKGIFFTDAKAGIYPDGEAVHWTAKEVLKGERDGHKKDYSGHLGNKKLIDAITDESLKENTNVLMKIDVVIPFYGKYLECTNVYEFYYLENGVLKGLNAEILSHENERDNIIKTLKEDTKKQLNNDKLFKVIKRIYALSRYYNDIATIRKIEPLLVSNVSKLSSINSDLKTLELLIELDKNINKNFVGIELNMLIDKMANILDINFDEIGVIENLKKLYEVIKQDDRQKAMKILDEVTRYLQVVTNREVLEYLNSIGFNSFKNFGSKYII